MEKKIKLFLLGCFLALIFLSFVNRFEFFKFIIFDTGYGMISAKKELVNIHIKDEKERNILFGDSRMVAAYNPSQNNQNNFNLAIPGGNAVQSFFLLKKLIKSKNNIKNIVLGYSPIRLNTDGSFRLYVSELLDGEEIQEIIDIFHINKNEFIEDRKIYNTTDFELLNCKFQTPYCFAYFYGLFLKQPLSFIRSHYSKQDTLLNNGWRVSQFNSNSKIPQESVYENTKFKTGNISNYFLIKTLNLANENNINTIFIGMPIPNGDIINSEFIRTYKEYIYSLPHIKSIYFLDSLPKEFFADGDHVNLNGSMIITNFINNILKQND